MHHSVFRTFRQSTYPRRDRVVYSRVLLAVNTRTVLAIVPPQGCEAILVEILQSKRSAGGPHLTCCFLKSEYKYNRSRYIIEFLTLILLCRASLVCNIALLHILSSVIPTAMLRARGSFH